MNEVDITMSPLKILARAIALTGSLYNLSRLSGINRGTLRNIYNKKYNTNMATILRLQDFIDHNSNRAGRPFKK